MKTRAKAGEITVANRNLLNSCIREADGPTFIEKKKK